MTRTDEENVSAEGQITRFDPLVLLFCGTNFEPLWLLYVVIHNFPKIEAVKNPFFSIFCVNFACYSTDIEF